MAFVDGNMSPADIAAVTGNGGLGSFGGDGAWLILILLLFAAFNGNGWGGGGYASPMGSEVQRGFDQQAVMGTLAGIQGSLASIASQNGSDRFDIITTLNSGHNAILQNLAQCCCDNRSAIADLKYTVATENCADRQVVSDGIRDVIQNQNQNTQVILDKLCQQEIDALKTQNANLQTQINLANLAASQNGQTAQILADNAAQTALLRQALNPTPIPAYVVQNPNGCGTYNGCGCV